MLKTFSAYLVEAAEQPAVEAAEQPVKGKPLTHLTHPEDFVIGGNEGVHKATRFLGGVHDKLIGKKSTKDPTHISTKYDGAPSIVFGIHPKTGKPFVATKSAFNKDPKINYTPEDIDANHGHAPGLAAKMKEALQHLPKIMPKKGGVYQGDLMYGSGDVQSKGGKHNFTPNTITYSADKDSEHGRAIQRAKLGIVVHTHYKGKGDLSNMSAGPLGDKDRSEFINHPDVHNIDPTLKPDTTNYTPDEQSEYHTHMEKAKMAYRRMKPEAFDALKGHGANLEAHINDMVRNGGKPSVDGYVKYLSKKATKDIESVKTPAAKDRKARAHSAAIEHIMNNREHFEGALQLHGHLQSAKNVLTKVMAKNNPFDHSIDGVPASPEGAVAVNKEGDMAKFVDRGGFSEKNFKKGGTFKNNGEKSITEAATIKPKTNPVVFAFGRMNPPTTGHGELVKKVKELAKKHGTPGAAAHHEIVLSGSVDPEKNPLTPEQKLMHAHRMFPGTNFSVATPDHPTILHHLARLHKAGHNHAIVVAGGDRLPEYQKLINHYNTTPDKSGKQLFNFESIKFVSSGDRDPDGDGVTGMSASKMRDHAKTDNFPEFKKGIPPHVSPEHAQELFNDVREGQQRPKAQKVKKDPNASAKPIETKTIPESLNLYKSIIDRFRGIRR